MSASAESQRRSIEDRLREVAGSEARLPRIRRRFATKVLLERLADQTDRWTLKGAFLLETRLEAIGMKVSSMTKDVDIATDSAVQLLEDLRESAGLSYLDPFEIRIHKPIKNKPSPDTDRRSVELRLAGREFERFQIDVAEQHTLQPYEPLLLDTEPLESHEVAVKAQTVSSALLDKLRAFSEVHTRGRRSSRTRDLPDMLHLIDLAGNQAAALATEALRQSEVDTPNEFPPLPDSWPATLRDRAGTTLDSAAVHKKLEAFWNPILKSLG